MRFINEVEEQYQVQIQNVSAVLENLVITSTSIELGDSAKESFDNCKLKEPIQNSQHDWMKGEG